MSYRFEAGRIYRMPTHFGPAPGPRQLPDEFLVDPKGSRSTLSVAASFLTDPAVLEQHLPERFTLAGEAVVTVEFHYITDIDWLAGRGYTMINVGWPATFTGSRDRATGKFLAVVWENLAERRSPRRRATRICKARRASGATHSFACPTRANF
jgi:hypothetical protein